MRIQSNLNWREASFCVHFWMDFWNCIRMIDVNVIERSEELKDLR